MPCQSCGKVHTTYEPCDFRGDIWSYVMGNENVPGGTAAHKPPDDSGNRFVGNMTMRDFFAGMVLMGRCQHYQHPSERDEGAFEAYAWADAMLRARERKQP